MLRGLFFRGQ